MEVRFSIIVANYNKALFIEEMINSVLTQTYVGFELIIVDDSSTDNSINIFQDFERSDKRIKLFKNEINRGANFSRNFGSSKANYDYLIFLDSDDVLLKDCLLNRSKVIERNEDNDMWIFSMKSFKGNLNNIVTEWIPPSDSLLDGFLSHRLPWTISQPVWHKNFFHKIGGFDESFNRLQDVELHTRALLNHSRVFISNNIADCLYRVDEGRITNIENHFLNFTSGALKYFSKFYSLVEKKKLLFNTLLYVIDNIWYAKKNGSISISFANRIVEQMINEAENLSNDRKRVSALKQYWKVKSKFNYNIKGLRYVFGKFIEYV
jgi:glycosyltransferase involved in cell wall biosynthesis